MISLVPGDACFPANEAVNCLNTLLPTTLHSFWWLKQGGQVGLVLATCEQTFDNVRSTRWLLVLVGGRSAWVDARQVLSV